MQSRLELRRTLVPALLLAVLAIPLTAQQTSRSRLFGEVIDVRVVNLEVVVTEGGERVTGLSPEDFQLTVDGNEVPIEYFTEVLGGTAVAQGAAADQDLGTVPALAPGVPVPTSYLVFIDEYFTVGAKRNRVLKRLIEQLPLLNPEDRMAVVAYNGKKLEMLSTWSQSSEALTRIFQSALERPSFGIHRAQALRKFGPDVAREQARLEQFEGLEQEDGLARASQIAGSLITGEEEMITDRLVEDVEGIVNAASASLRSFAKPPGRKVMMLLSGGWPYAPAQWAVRDPTRQVYTTGYGYGDNLFAPLIETANRLSYTLYPIDVPRQSDTVANVDTDISDFERIRTERLNDLSDQRGSLRLLAYDTGGRALFADETLHALERVAADTRSYYWVGFTPKWQGDDAAHEVQIDVLRRGLEVRSRQSFSDLSRTREVTMMVESALRLGDAPTMTPMPARIGEIKKAGRGKVEVPVELLIPIHALTFLPQEDRFLAEVELRVAALNDEGTAADIPVIPLTFHLDDPPKDGDMRRFETRILLRKRRHDVVLSLYDNASGTILSTKLEVNL